MSVREIEAGYVETDGTIHWEIANFGQLCPENAPKFSCTRSPIFSVGQKDGQPLEWVLGLTGHEDHIVFVLFLVTNKKTKNVVADDKPNLVNCSYKIGFGNKNNPFVVSEFETRHFNMGNCNSSEFHFYLKTSDLYRRREELLQEDTLRITTQMQIDLDDSLTEFPPVFKDFSREQISDFEIKCGESSCPCHKLILSNRSSVFNRMFESGLEETVNGQVVIQDMKPAAVETLLKFMYTGQVNRPENCSWTELIHGAEKYDLMDLKNFCFKKMCKEGTLNSCGTLFVAAQTYNSTMGIKIFVIKYYEAQLKELMKNPEFRDVLFKNQSRVYPE